MRKIAAGFGPVSLPLLAPTPDVPLTNWTVPPYTRGSSDGLKTMTDATPPRAFIGIQPCRIADTRGNGAPIQGGIFPNGGLRTWTVIGVCGIPLGADAISANFTVTGSPSAPPGAFLTAWPTGGAPPPVSILNFQAGQTVANAAIVRGRVTGASPLFGSSGVEGVITSTNPDGGTAGVRGINNGAFSQGVGVWGSQNGSGWGVFGESLVGYGVNGHVTGEPSSTAAAGVRGAALSPNTLTPGVLGQAGQGPGVLGESEFGVGVRGTGKDGGGAGVRGVLRNGAGTILASGYLGFDDGATNYGVFYVGGLEGQGTKSFLEPHPTDPSKEIRFLSLEGNEAGTYFRGKGRFQNGIALIQVPDEFRLVTSPEDLSIQVTPIGQMATVAVVSIGLDGIVVRASRDVAFFYTVNGVRRAYRDIPVIVPNDHFFPESPDAPLPLYLSADERQRLIDNGTYRPDGTVNMETARRLGWQRQWQERRRPVVSRD